MDTEQTNLSVEKVLGVLRRRTPWVLACLMLVAGSAYAFSKAQTKQYTATASLAFNNNQLGQQVAGLSVDSSEAPVPQQNTNLKLVELGDMAAKTAGVLGQGLTKNKVAEDVSVGAQGESNIVNVSATATSPALAADIANTYTNQFVTEQQKSNHAYYAAALNFVNKQLRALPAKERTGTVGLALEERAQSLAAVAELRYGNVQVAEAAAPPTSPSSPKVARNTVLGAILGLLLGLGVAFLLERFDRRIRDPRDLEAIYRLPLLGVVPESTALARSARASRSKRRKKKANAALPPSEEEAFRLIRAHLRYFNVDRELRTLLVASAAPGDGKTTIARHLASTATRMGSRVLLLEADLRRPTLAQQLDVQPGPGVSDVLIGAVSLNEATQMVDLNPSPVDGTSAGQTLDVVVAAAALPPNPGELIESRAMEALLERAKSMYDLVVIDTGPLAAVSDAFPLLGKVDGVIIVGRVGRNRRDVADRLHETLASVGAPLLGVVANGVKVRRLGSYGYAHGYPYAAAEDDAHADAEHYAPVEADHAHPEAEPAEVGIDSDKVDYPAAGTDYTASEVDDVGTDDYAAPATAVDRTATEADSGATEVTEVEHHDAGEGDDAYAEGDSADTEDDLANAEDDLASTEAEHSGSIGAGRASSVGASTNGASANGTSANGVAPNGAAADGTYDDMPDETAPAQPVRGMATTYGEAVDLLGRLGDLSVESSTGESRRSRRRRRSLRRG